MYCSTLPYGEGGLGDRDPDDPPSEEVGNEVARFNGCGGFFWSRISNVLCEWSLCLWRLGDSSSNTSTELSVNWPNECTRERGFAFVCRWFAE